eukprot:2606297-Prorocentrum_lima.AAC.1
MCIRDRAKTSPWMLRPPWDEVTFTLDDEAFMVPRAWVVLGSGKLHFVDHHGPYVSCNGCETSLIGEVPLPLKLRT